MQAIEFETLIGQETIPIPMQYKYLAHRKAKIIILFQEEQIKPNYDKNALLFAFTKAKKQNSFSKINNSLNWQKQLRDDWE